MQNNLYKTINNLVERKYELKRIGGYIKHDKMIFFRVFTFVVNCIKIWLPQNKNYSCGLRYISIA